MLRLGPTRISLGEEDLRYHLERVYLNQTVYTAGYDMDPTDSDEDEDEDEDDEDDEISVDSQPFPPYGRSRLKASDSEYTSETDNWPSQERWQTNWRANAASLSATLATSVTLETSLSPCVEVVSSVGADHRARGVKGAITQGASEQSQHDCYPASPLHSPVTDTLTPTCLKSEPRVFRELPPNTADERISRRFKSPKTYITRHLPLSLPHELGGSTDFCVSFSFTTLTLTLQHTPWQRQQQHNAGNEYSPVLSNEMLTLFVTTASPKTTIRLSQQSKHPHPNLSIKTCPSAHSAKLTTLIGILTRVLQEVLKVETIIMDGARSPGNSAPWRRIRTRNPAWRQILENPSFHGRAAEQGPQMSPAAPVRDSRHLSEPVATAESPSRPDFQRTRFEYIGNDGHRMHSAMPLSSSALAVGNVEIPQVTRVLDADADRFSGFLPTIRELDPVGNTPGPARLSLDGEAQQDHTAFLGPANFLPVMEPPLMSPPWASSAPEYYRISRERHVPMETYRPVEAIPEAYPSLAAGDRYDLPAIAQEQSTTTHSSVEAVSEVYPSLAADDRYDIPAIAREQSTRTHSPVEATPPASPAARVQPFTPVNPQSRTRQEGSATPHGSHPDPNHNDEAEAKIRTAVRSIERRLKRMMADEFREPESIRIVDYGLGALRRKPLGEWYREAVNKDE